LTHMQFGDSLGFASIGGYCAKGNGCYAHGISRTWSRIQECRKSTKCESVVIPTNFQSLNTSLVYEKACDGNYCAENCEVNEIGFSTCYAKCIPYNEPCWGHCYDGQVLLAGKCVLASDTFQCGVETKLLEDSCDGRCLPGRVQIEGKCILDTWKCEGKIQSPSTPCLGSCPQINTRSKVFLGEYNYLNDYVLGGDKCLLRSEAWDCNGYCQHHSTPCNKKCLFVLCVVGIDWMYKNIGGTCIKIPKRGFCMSGAWFPIYTSATT
jgi:hypothetical protein